MRMLIGAVVLPLLAALGSALLIAARWLGGATLETALLAGTGLVLYLVAAGLGAGLFGAVPPLQRR
jgi:hypothetical protein